MSNLRTLQKAPNGFRLAEVFLGIRILLSVCVVMTSCIGAQLRTPSSRPKAYPELQFEKNSSYCGIVRSVDKQTGWVQIDVGADFNTPRMIQVNDKTSRSAEKLLDQVNMGKNHEKDFLLCENQSSTFERTWEVKFNSQVLYSCKGFLEQPFEAKKIETKFATTEASLEKLNQRISENKIYKSYVLQAKDFAQIEKKWDGQLLTRILHSSEPLIPLVLEENEALAIYKSREQKAHFELYYSKVNSKWPENEIISEAQRKPTEIKLPQPPDCDEVCQDGFSAKTEIKGRSWLEFVPESKRWYQSKKENDAKSTGGYFICKKPTAK